MFNSLSPTTRNKIVLTLALLSFLVLALLAATDDWQEVPPPEATTAPTPALKRGDSTPMTLASWHPPSRKTQSQLRKISRARRRARRYGCTFAEADYANAWLYTSIDKPATARLWLRRANKHFMRCWMAQQ